MVLWTKEQVAEFLGVSPATIRDWRQDGLIPYIKIKGCLRFDRDDIMKWLEKRKVRADLNPSRRTLRRVG